jgi:two-component system, OmpR family, phosphate regulon sensor histidine kinase PhoR
VEGVPVTAQIDMPRTDDLWRLTMEHSPVGMALVSLSGDFISVNVALCDMLGHPPEALAGLTFRDITHPDDVGSDARLVLRALADEIGSYRITKRYLRADGQVVIGDLSVALLRGPDGTPIHFICQIVDLTERHAIAQRLDVAEATIEFEQRKADAVFDTVAVGLLLLDADGGYQGYNSRHQVFMDLAFPEGHRGRVGQTGFLFDAEQTRPLTSEEMPTTRAVAGEEFDDCRVWVGEDPHARRAMSVSARSVRDRDGAFAGAALAYHDVTELVRALKVKDEFVTTVSHELRTPLTSALAHLELLEDSTDVGDDARRQVAAAQRNIKRLSRLVADLLFVTRATSGSSLVDPYRVDLVRVVAEALEAARPVASAAGVDLTAALPESLETMVDGMRLRQVVDNVLANAILYGRPDGHVTVSLEASDEHIVLTVADDGEGIEESDLPGMFQRFFRGQNAHRRQVPGTGLGLSIVRTIVEAHGGEVSLESHAGVGSTVRITLPR